MEAPAKDDGYEKFVLTMKREKAKLKTNFTRARKKLIALLEGSSLQSEVQDANQHFDTALDEVIEVIDKLSNAYMQGDEIEKSKGTISELEKIEDEYARTIAAVCEYMENTRSERGSICTSQENVIPSLKR